MSLQRQVRKLNRILLAETGQNPVREWMHSLDSRLLHPMRVYERDGSVVYDYHCQCGKNVRIHHSGCLLTMPQPRWEKQHLLGLTLPKERYADCWLVGCRTFPDKTWWEHSFNGCPYPSDGAWYPFSDQRGVLILNQGTPPNEDLNWELVKMIREWNDLRSGMDQARAESQLLREKDQDSKIDSAMRDATSVSSRPGAKEEVSFPSVKVNPLRVNQRTELAAPLLSQN